VVTPLRIEWLSPELVAISVKQAANNACNKFQDPNLDLKQFPFDNRFFDWRWILLFPEHLIQFTPNMIHHDKYRWIVFPL